MKYEKWSEDKIAQKAVLCKTKQEMRKRFPKEYDAAKRMGLLSHSIFSHMGKQYKSRKPSKWGTKEAIFREALKFKTRKEFFDRSQGCYGAAKRKGCFEEACSHMPKNICIGNKPPTFKWNKEAIAKEALKYRNKNDFRNKSAGAWDAAVKNKWIKEVCSHMDSFIRHFELEELIEIFKDCKNKKEAREKNIWAYNAVKRKNLQTIVFAHMPERILLSGENSPFYKWTDDKLKKISLKYQTRMEFRDNDSKAYDAAYKKGVLDEICKHMGESVTEAWENSDIIAEALKYETRLSFQKNSSGAYQAAKKRKILDDICSHMKRSGNVSSHEEYLFDQIKSIYPKTQKFRDMKVKIDGKPYIHGFEIDVYIPELRRGVEFDGTYWHSFKKMRSNPKKAVWPDEDIRNYHEIKDSWFASKGIQVLHIKEEDWNKNKEACIKKCLGFLDK